MKLYPLLFTNEAAKTPEESLLKGIAAFKADEFQSRIVLVDVKKLFDIVLRLMKENDLNKVDSNSIKNSYFSEDAKAALAREAIVGFITFGQLTDEYKDLYSVTTSAAQDKFGPLLYQIVMFDIQPAWLTSDFNLKPASEFLWKKMYELSNSGTYQRKFLGDWSYHELASKCDIKGELLHSYEEKLLSQEIPPDEQHLIEWLNKYNPEVKPEDVAFLWAYRTVNYDQKIIEMFKKAEEAIEVGDHIHKISPTILKHLIKLSGLIFFNKMYGSAASYSE